MSEKTITSDLKHQGACADDRELLDYIEAMARQFAQLAQRAGHNELGYYLEMASRQAHDELHSDRASGSQPLQS